MLQIAFVPHKHDDDLVIGVVAQLLEPSLHVLVGSMFGNVVDQESADSASIVGGSDGPVAFLPSCETSALPRWRARDREMIGTGQYQSRV